MAVTLAANGIARWYNPVWWFITGYYRIFMRITLGASRLQEMLADRVAAMSYGTRALTSGLQTFIRTSLEFNLKVNAEVKEAKAVGRSLNNLYSLPNLLDPGPLEKKLAEVMAHPPSPYDSHPAPRQRLTLIERIPAGGYFDDGPRPAWDLIPNASQIQEEATSQIEAQIRR
jgi:Zn-dependent protease with chaperone function